MEVFKQTLFAQVVDITSLPTPATDAARLRVILTLAFTITGSIALLVITIAGFRYVISHGDPSLITQSKNSIMYALIGLAVSVGGIAIVNFVVSAV